jgi:hypothetical protein
MNAIEALSYLKESELNRIKNSQGGNQYRFILDDTIIEMGSGENEMFAMNEQTFLVSCKDEIFEVM